MITATLFSDPACPWAYSESPALRVLEWRYGDQLDWKLILIGLTEDASQYAARGYTPLRGALGQLSFRRYGMPFAPVPKERRAPPRAPAGRSWPRGSNRPAANGRCFAHSSWPTSPTGLVLEDDEAAARRARRRARDRRRRGDRCA